MFKERREKVYNFRSSSNTQSSIIFNLKINTSKGRRENKTNKPHKKKSKTKKIRLTQQNTGNARCQQQKTVPSRHRK